MSSREQEAVIAADRNSQSGSNGGGDGDGNGDATGANYDSGGGNNEDNDGSSANEGHKQESTKYSEENVVAKATAAVRW